MNELVVGHSTDMAHRIEDLLKQNAELLKVCLFVLDELEHLTTDDFSKGGDKPARDKLEEVIAKAGE